MIHLYRNTSTTRRLTATIRGQRLIWCGPLFIHVNTHKLNRVLHPWQYRNVRRAEQTAATFYGQATGS